MLHALPGAPGRLVPILKGRAHQQAGWPGSSHHGPTGLTADQVGPSPGRWRPVHRWGLWINMSQPLLARSGPEAALFLC